MMNADELEVDAQPGDPEDGWSSRDEAILNLYAHGDSQAKVAAKLGVAAKTIQRRFADPTFREEAEHRRDEWLDELAQQATTLAPVAFDALAKIIQSGEDGDIIRACQTVLQATFKLDAERRFRTSTDRRIATLETALLRAREANERLAEPPRPVWEASQ